MGGAQQVGLLCSLLFPAELALFVSALYFQRLPIKMFQSLIIGEGVRVGRSLKRSYYIQTSISVRKYLHKILNCLRE